MNSLVGSVSRCLEIQRAAGWAGKCPWRGSMAVGKQGKDLCLSGMGSYGEDLMGPPLGLVLTSRVFFYCQLPIAPSEKEAEKRRNAYASKEVPRVAVALWEQHLAPQPAACAWCPLLHGVCCCCPRHGHSPRETSGCLRSGVGRQ